MCSVHSVFHVSMLKPTTSNTFSERIQLAPAPVIIDEKSKYKISQIVDFKIDCWQVCKLLYKVIWLGCEDTGDKSEYISTSKLTHITDLVFDFHIVYPTKPSPLPLFWSCCCISPLPLYIFQFHWFFSILYLLIFTNPQLLCTFWGFFSKTSFYFIFFSYSYMLWLMPSGNSMEKGQEYDDMIGCTTSNLSQRLM